MLLVNIILSCELLNHNIADRAGLPLKKKDISVINLSGNKHSLASLRTGYETQVLFVLHVVVWQYLEQEQHLGVRKWPGIEDMT